MATGAADTFATAADEDADESVVGRTSADAVISTLGGDALGDAGAGAIIEGANWLYAITMKIVPTMASRWLRCMDWRTGVPVVW